MSPATLTGTGTMTAPRPVLPEPQPGLYPVHRYRGVTVHLMPSPTTLSALRHLTAAVLEAYGADEMTVWAVEQVVSELVANAAAAGGPHVPVVVDAYCTADGVALAVHDPLSEKEPQRSELAMDNDTATSGRGLQLVDAYAPGWTVAYAMTGKWISCHIQNQ